jgi:hypothetical protein
MPTPGPTDNVPAALTPGEIVLNLGAVKLGGKDKLLKLNAEGKKLMDSQGGVEAFAKKNGIFGKKGYCNGGKVSGFQYGGSVQDPLQVAQATAEAFKPKLANLHQRSLKGGQDGAASTSLLPMVGVDIPSVAQNTASAIPKVTDTSGAQQAMGAVSKPIVSNVIGGGAKANSFSDDTPKATPIGADVGAAGFNPSSAQNMQAKQNMFNSTPGIAGMTNAPTNSQFATVANSTPQGFSEGGEVKGGIFKRGYAKGGFVSGVSSFVPDQSDLTAQNKDTKLGEGGFDKNPTKTEPKTTPTTSKVSEFTPDQSDLTAQNANTKLGEGGFTQNVKPEPKITQTSAKVGEFIPKETEIKGQNTGKLSPEGFTENNPPAPKTRPTTAKVGKFTPTAEEAAAQNYDTVGAKETPEGIKKLSVTEAKIKARPNFTLEGGPHTVLPTRTATSLEPGKGLLKAGGRNVVPASGVQINNPSREWVGSAGQSAGSASKELVPAGPPFTKSGSTDFTSDIGNSGPRTTFNKSQQEAREDVINSGKERVAALKEQNAAMEKGTPGEANKAATGAAAPQSAGWEAGEEGSPTWKGIFNGAKNVVGKVAGTALRGANAAGDVLMAAHTASEKSPIEQYAESRGVTGADPQEVWRKPLREKVEGVESSLAEGAKEAYGKAKNYFGNRGVGKEAAKPATSVTPVATPEVKPAAPATQTPVAQTPVQTPVAPESTVESQPKDLGSVEKGQGFVQGANGKKYSITKEGIFKFDPKTNAWSKTSLAGGPPTQSAAAQAAGTTDFNLNWANADKYRAAQQAKEEHANREAQRQNLMNMAMSNPNGSMGPVEFGNAKRNKATALHMLESMGREDARGTNRDLEERKLNAAEKHTAATEKHASATEEYNRRHLESTEKRDEANLGEAKRRNDLAEQREAFAQANKPSKYVTKAGEVLSLTPDERRQAVAKDRLATHLEKRAAELKPNKEGYFSLSDKEAAAKSEQEHAIRQQRVAEILQGDSTPEQKEAILKAYKQATGVDYNDLI